MLSQNNWMQIDWDGKPLRSKTENVRVQFVHHTATALPFDQACDIVADDIATKFDRLAVSFSGGCDSENICNTFLRNGIKFTPIVFYDKTVPHSRLLLDKWFADFWCRKNKIEPLYVDVKPYLESQQDNTDYRKIRPRLFKGLHIYGLMRSIGEQMNFNIVTGAQLEYYPDADQMEYLRPQLKDYDGFVMNESDCYLDCLVPERHPWAFYYWNSDIMASYVTAWDTNLTMAENKSAIYGVPPRPKLYNSYTYSEQFLKVRRMASERFGTNECAKLGTKQVLLSQLLK